MDDRTIVLWPDGTPDATGEGEGHNPTLTPMSPQSGSGSGSAVIVCPGGGYDNLDLVTARQTGEWLTSLGILVFILKYRVAPLYHHPAPLMDLQRAIKIIRCRADEFGIGRDRIGVLGYSAGGHVAACAGTLFENGDLEASDPIERWSSRPDALMLIYPVVSMVEYCHLGSRNNLLSMAPRADSDADDILDEMLEKMGMAGVDAEDNLEARTEEKPDEAEVLNEALLESLSVHKQVSSQMPPTFLVHTANDAEVPCENSILLSEALRKKGVPMEFHLYEEGPHGFGLALNQPHLATWTGLCARWLQLRGFVGSIKEKEPE